MAQAKKPAAKKKAAPKKKPAPKPKKKPAPKPAPRKKPAPKKKPAVQHTPAPAAPAGGARVVEILEDEHPVDALRRFLGTIDGRASTPQGQIALGSAQLMLLPIAREHRGGQEVKDLLDLVLDRWDD